MERNNAIDSVAGVMITYMVFTHVCQHFKLDNSTYYMALEHIFYFFMPWFFYKAGMFFKVGDNKATFNKGIRRLIIPFIKYSLIGHVCYCLIYYFNGDLHLSTIIPIHSLFMQGSVPGNLPLWFLLSLFMCRVIFNALQMKGLSTYIVSTLSLSVAFLLHKINFVQPFYAANIWTGLFFMSMGYLLKKHNVITPPYCFYVL